MWQGVGKVVARGRQGIGNRGHQQIKNMGEGKGQGEGQARDKQGEGRGGEGSLACMADNVQGYSL